MPPFSLILLLLKSKKNLARKGARTRARRACLELLSNVASIPSKLTKDCLAHFWINCLEIFYSSVVHISAILSKLDAWRLRVVEGVEGVEEGLELFLFNFSKTFLQIMPHAPPPRIAAADVPRPKNHFEKSPPEKFGQAVLGIFWCARKEKW